MAFDYKVSSATLPSCPRDADRFCPECGRPWDIPAAGSARRAAPFPWRAALLAAVGLYLGITFGLRGVGDYPRALRDQAILQATDDCLARTGGRSDCAPSNVSPDGSTDRSVLATQAATSRRKLGEDTLGTIAGVIAVFLALGAWRGRRAERLRPADSAASTLARVGEGLVAASCPLAVAWALVLVGAQLGRAAPLATILPDQAAAGVLAVISVVTGGS
jgi:hypothetical protein